MANRWVRIVPLAALLLCLGSSAACMTAEDAYASEPVVLERLAAGGPSHGAPGEGSEPAGSAWLFEDPPTGP